MATKVPVKSIIKQQSSPQPSTSFEQAAKEERDRHNYNLALQHAYRIQAQKDWEARVLKVIEILLEYPAETRFTAHEANRFTAFVQPFQHSDLDALVEERRVDGKCGYALCAKAPRSVTMGKDAVWRVGQGAADFCSTRCAKKSAYVKAQLSEIPAWERAPGIHPKVILHEDDRPNEQAASQGPKVDGKQQTVANDNDELAFERGEKATNFRPKQVMTDRIVEKATTTHKPSSSVSGAVVSHTAIEGYEPRWHAKASGGKHDDSNSEDEDDDGKAAGEGYDGD